MVIEKIYAAAYKRIMNIRLYDCIHYLKSLYNFDSVEHSDDYIITAKCDEFTITYGVPWLLCKPIINIIRNGNSIQCNIRMLQEYLRYSRICNNIIHNLFSILVDNGLRIKNISASINDVSRMSIAIKKLMNIPADSMLHRIDARVVDCANELINITAYANQSGANSQLWVNNEYSICNVDYNLLPDLSFLNVVDDNGDVVVIFESKHHIFKYYVNSNKVTCQCNIVLFLDDDLGSTFLTFTPSKAISKYINDIICNTIGSI